MQNSQLNPIVVVGTSGSGKSTLKHYILKKYPQTIVESISWTTRKPREGEVDKKDYCFVSKEEFQKEIDNNGFVEYAIVHGNMYGSQKAQVDKILQNGQICLFEIDVQGAQKVKKVYPDALFIFIALKSDEVQEQRLRGRKSDSEEVIQVRLKNALDEIKQVKLLDYFKEVINDQLEQAQKDIENLILNNYKDKVVFK